MATQLFQGLYDGSRVGGQLRDWSLLIPGTGAEGNIIFFSKNS